MMHRHTASIAGFIGSLLLVGSAHAQSGGPYALTWSTIDDGGATLASSGGPYTVAGTIGQPDAGPVQSGVPYTDTGGFWNKTIASCPADFNGSGAVSVQDIFDFLSAYFSNQPAADFNHSGAVSVQDIFDFLGAYFSGC
jgi:hypothetical protein